MRTRILAILVTGFLIPNGFCEENLLVDPSFERATLGDGRPPGWAHWQPEGSKYKASVVAEAHTGKRSVLLSGEGQFTTFTTSDYRIAPGDCYLFGGWVRLEGEAGTEASVKLDLTRKDGSWLRDMSSCLVRPSNSEWRSVVMISRFEEAPDAAQFRVVFTLGGKGKLWVDDAFLAKIPSPTPNGLLVNGDMELVAQEAIAGWQANNDAAAEVALSPIAEGLHGGKAALRLTGKGTWGSANSLRAPIRADRVHKGAVWVKVAEGTVRVQLTYWDGGRWLGATDSERASAGDWRLLSVDADKKKFEKVTHLSLAVVCEGPKIDVVMDDAEIRESDPAAK